VNNVADVRGLPWWTYHRGNVNGMTYVDMVFPGFLFLMGMAIPLAVDARIARGQSLATIWTHVAWRAASLLALGLFIANATHVDAQHTHLSQVWWTILGLVAITLAWVHFPGGTAAKSPV
jgi:heparan-alpha-glucosaminide N-acetyltransferase